MAAKEEQGLDLDLDTQVSSPPLSCQSLFSTEVVTNGGRLLLGREMMP